MRGSEHVLCTTLQLLVDVSRNCVFRSEITYIRFGSITHTCDSESDDSKLLRGCSQSFSRDPSLPHSDSAIPGIIVFYTFHFSSERLHGDPSMYKARGRYNTRASVALQ
jgi:hypothetical protein